MNLTLKIKATRDVNGNSITRFLSDTAMNLSSKLIKFAAPRALMYEVLDWDEEFDSVGFEDDIEVLQETTRLLDEAYANYFLKSLDGSAKGSDGSVKISFGTYFDRKNFGLKVNRVTIFSYVFCKERSIDFATPREALEEVKKWHKKEMSLDYSKMKEYDDRYEHLLNEWLSANPNKNIEDGDEFVIQQLESEGLRWDFYND